MKTIQILSLIFLSAVFFTSCDEDIKEMEKEQEIYTPQKSWNETAVFKDKTWNYTYTKELSGGIFLDDFSFDGENDSLETDISTEDDPIVEGKTYLLGNSVEKSFVNNILWTRKGEFGSKIEYQSISGMFQLTKVNVQEANFNREAFAYIDGNYEATVVYQTDTVVINGIFKDVYINL